MASPEGERLRESGCKVVGKLILGRMPGRGVGGLAGGGTPPRERLQCGRKIDPGQDASLAEYRGRGAADIAAPPAAN